MRCKCQRNATLAGAYARRLSYFTGMPCWPERAEAPASPPQSDRVSNHGTLCASINEESAMTGSGVTWRDEPKVTMRRVASRSVVIRSDSS